MMFFCIIWNPIFKKEVICLIRGICWAIFFIKQSGFMLHNSQMKADKKKGVGTDCPYPILRLLALPFIADKNNSPHQRLCKKPIKAEHTNSVVPL